MAVKGTDHAALVDRLARAMAWTELDHAHRQRYLTRAGVAVDEMETDHDQVNVVGWLFVTLDPEEAETS